MSKSTYLPAVLASSQIDIESIDSGQAKTWVSELITNQCFVVLTITALVYDAILTMDKEVRYFWKIPRAAVDFVYFANRYLGILGSVAILFCNFAVWTRSLCQEWITIVSIDYILLVRVIALYSQDQRLSIYLYVLFVVEAVLKMGTMAYLIYWQHIAVFKLANDVIVCGAENFAAWQLGMVNWLIPMIYGLILMILALHKAAKYWRISAGFKGLSLVKVLIRDQVVYFMFLIMCCLFAILEFRLEISSNFLSNVLNCLGNPSFLTILGSRMLFNLKEAGERGENVGTSYRASSTAMSEMNFAEPEKLERSGYMDGGNCSEVA
ncbi:hypothetical protein ACEPAG_2912 [Sanghuangporus baumii]